MPKSTKSSKKVVWETAPDIEKDVKKLVSSLGLSWVDKKRVFGFRSKNSKAKAYARIWGLSRVFQQALKTEPAYIIEVISERFDGLSEDKKTQILLHELTHIPKTFSGSLLPHFKKGRFKFHDEVEELFARYKRLK